MRGKLRPEGRIWLAEQSGLVPLRRNETSQDLPSGFQSASDHVFPLSEHHYSDTLLALGRSSASDYLQYAM